MLENALEEAKLINLENPTLRALNQANQVINEPENLFYKGSKILSHEIIYLKRVLIKLEDDQFNFEIISDKSFIFPVKAISKFTYFVPGIILGIFLSLGIILFKRIIKDNY